MSLVSSYLRYSFGRSDAARDSGLTTPEDVVRYDDILYGDDPRWQALDVYRPRAGEGKVLPVIVSVHGGGWVYGDKTVYQFYCMSLARRGFAVVNFSYRLAPKHKYPAQLEDVNSVFHWVLAHAAEYGFDPEHIFAVGDSAGANLLGLYCAICTDPGCAARFPFRPPGGFVPSAVALNCGQYRVEPKRLPTDLIHLLILDYLPRRGSAEELEAIDVTAHINGRFPPVFLMTASDDFLREQVPILSRKLDEAGVPYISRCYGDAEHPLEHVFHCNVRSRDADLCNDEECAFFRGFLENDPLHPRKEERP